jgi:hypothetical protein
VHHDALEREVVNVHGFWAETVRHEVIVMVRACPYVQSRAIAQMSGLLARQRISVLSPFREDAIEYSVTHCSLPVAAQRAAKTVGASTRRSPFVTFGILIGSS